MSGGGKGPSSSGNITQTTSNKTADTLLPYQQGGWDAARYTFDNNPTPRATILDLAPYVSDRTRGSATIAHGSSPATDLEFSVLLIG